METAAQRRTVAAAWGSRRREELAAGAKLTAPRSAGLEPLRHAVKPATERGRGALRDAERRHGEQARYAGHVQRPGVDAVVRPRSTRRSPLCIAETDFEGPRGKWERAEGERTLLQPRGRPVQRVRMDAGRSNDHSVKCGGVSVDLQRLVGRVLPLLVFLRASDGVEETARLALVHVDYLAVAAQRAHDAALVLREAQGVRGRRVVSREVAFAVTVRRSFRTLVVALVLGKANLRWDEILAVAELLVSRDVLEEGDIW